MSLFDADDFYAEAARAYDGAAIIGEDRVPGGPDVETSHCGRVGFWRERSPAVFGIDWESAHSSSCPTPTS